MVLFVIVSTFRARAQSDHLTGWCRYVRKRRKMQAPLPQYIRILNFSSTYTYFGVHRVKNTELVVWLLIYPSGFAASL